jgi:hypothetical protein
MSVENIAFWVVCLLVVGPVSTLVVFLVVRWFWLWYWRVNEQLEVLQDIRAGLQRLEAPGRPVAPAAPAAPAPLLTGGATGIPVRG